MLKFFFKIEVTPGHEKCSGHIRHQQCFLSSTDQIRTTDKAAGSCKKSTEKRFNASTLLRHPHLSHIKVVSLTSTLGIHVKRQCVIAADSESRKQPKLITQGNSAKEGFSCRIDEKEGLSQIRHGTKSELRQPNPQNYVDSTGPTVILTSEGGIIQDTTRVTPRSSLLLFMTLLTPPMAAVNPPAFRSPVPPGTTAFCSLAGNKRPAIAESEGQFDDAAESDPIPPLQLPNPPAMTSAQYPQQGQAQGSFPPQQQQQQRRTIHADDLAFLAKVQVLRQQAAARMLVAQQAAFASPAALNQRQHLRPHAHPPTLCSSSSSAFSEDHAASLASTTAAAGLVHEDPLLREAAARVAAAEARRGQVVRAAAMIRVGAAPEMTASSALSCCSSSSSLSGWGGGSPGEEDARSDVLLAAQACLTLSGRPREAAGEEEEEKRDSEGRNDGAAVTSRRETLGLMPPPCLWNGGGASSGRASPEETVSSPVAPAKPMTVSSATLTSVLSGVVKPKKKRKVSAGAAKANRDGEVGGGVKKPSGRKGRKKENGMPRRPLSACEYSL